MTAQTPHRLGMLKIIYNDENKTLFYINKHANKTFHGK